MFEKEKFLKFEKTSFVKEEKGILFNNKCEDIVDCFLENNIKVNHIITDPPYYISQENRFKSLGRSGLDFGDWDKMEIYNVENIYKNYDWINKYSKIIDLLLVKQKV